MTEIPDRVMQEAWSVLQTEATEYSDVERIARAIMAAERRGMLRAAEIVRPAIETIPMDHGERVFCLMAGEHIAAAIRREARE